MVSSIIRCGMWRRIGYVVLLTLSNGISSLSCELPRRFTNVDDVTQDHANPRAVRTIAKSVFRGAAFHLATHAPPQSFFGTICGRLGPITSLTPGVLRCLLPHG
jgi:hypothetical protein